MVTQLVNLYAIREIYYAHPDKKWYFNYGCDNYVNTDYMNLMLDQYDHTQDLWIASFPVTERMPTFVDMTKHPKGKGKTYQWALGSSSWVMSNSVAKAFAEYIDVFLTDPDYDFKKTGVAKVCYCPDKVAGLVLSLLGFKITALSGKWARGKWAPLSMDSVGSYGDNGYAAGENIVYHYVSPRKMLAADQKAQHEKLDRIINADDAQGVVDMTRETIDHHFRALRKLQIQIKWLADQGMRGNRSLVQNWGDVKFPWNHYNDIGDWDPQLEIAACSKGRGGDPEQVFKWC